MEIKSILIQNFRGIPSSLSLDLTAKGAGPTSVVILGDNGSGKSSIIDAIEFCLQGRLHRSTRIEYDDIPEAHSYFSLRDASVKVEFENGESFERDIVQVDKNRSFNSKPIKGFSKIPIALRRKDILRFWNTPKEERQKVFFDFLGAKDTNIEHISPDQIISVLKQQQIELRKNRKDAILELEKKTKIKGIPNTIRSFDKYVEKRPILIKIGKELVERIKKYNSELIKVNEEIRNLNESSKKGLLQPNKEFLKGTLSTINERIFENFKIISSSSHLVNSIKLVVSERTMIELNVIVELYNGKRTTPERVFSEANLDLLALLINLELIHNSIENGQQRILLIDDVFQSIDSVFRMRCIRLIIEKFHDWQIIVTCHERLLQEQIRELFRQKSKKIISLEILRWEKFTGPIVTSEEGSNISVLQSRIEQGTTFEICSQTGLLLEKIFNDISWRLPISVSRKRFDRYTLGDLWPGIKKILIKTNLKGNVEEIDEWIVLRNLLGAHYNEWAQSLSRTEAIEFGNSVLEFYHLIYCRSCFRLIEEEKIGASSKKIWSCRCGALRIE